MSETPKLNALISRLAPSLFILSVLGLALFQLRNQGRSWWCACQQYFPWAGDIWSAHNSQHLLDPYSFTHLLHGFAFCWLLALAIPRLSSTWRLALATLLEAAWEVFENTEFVIRRYREETAALGYNGDSVFNSFGDILLCIAGFMIAQRLGFKRSVLVFVATELVLLLWIRDSLLLEILMLVYPIEGLKAWQIGK
ncbi:MAG TPA: DUF2585 family protein [Pyrinomonadaceae bacterium]|nr:DUF2585 family protein [Pyrinomonadaceae bacterium]